MNKLAISSDGSVLVGAHPEAGVVHIKRLEGAKPDISTVSLNSNRC